MNKDIVEGALRDHWLSLRDDCSPERLAYVRGAIGMAAVAGAISETEALIWSRVINACPGHEDDGRSWCAYCGGLRERTQHGSETP